MSSIHVVVFLWLLMWTSYPQLDYGSWKFSWPKFWKMCSVCRTASSDSKISVITRFPLHSWFSTDVLHKAGGLICTHIFYSIHPRYVSKLNIIWSTSWDVIPEWAAVMGWGFLSPSDRCWHRVTLDEEIENNLGQFKSVYANYKKCSNRKLD